MNPTSFEKDTLIGLIEHLRIGLTAFSITAGLKYTDREGQKLLASYDEIYIYTSSIIGTALYYEYPQLKQRLDKKDYLNFRLSMGEHLDFYVALL